VFAEPPPFQLAPTPPPERVWRGQDVIFGFGGLILGYLLISAVFAATALVTRLDDPQVRAVSFIVTIFWQASFASVVLLLALQRGATLRALGFRKPERWSPLPIIIVVSYGSLLGYGILIELLKQLGIDVGWFEGGNQIDIMKDDSVFPLPVMLLILGFAVSIVAPLAEELFFRGLVYRALSETWSPFLAIFVSGLLFGAFHLNLGVLIPFTILGMLLAWGFRASGSIWVPIITHFTINSVTLTVTVIGVLN
jgi:membrane protease YdiL (CAAX protease family)